MKRYFLSILLIITVSAVFSQQNLSISGAVKDTKGNPIQGATVFISNSRIITTSNAQGQFSLTPLQSGTYELVVRMLGFNSSVQPVTLQKPIAGLNIVLKDDAVNLQEVVIRTRSRAAADPERPKYLELFKQYFIGRLLRVFSYKIVIGLFNISPKIGA